MTKVTAGNWKWEVWTIRHLQQLEGKNGDPIPPENTILFLSSILQVRKVTGVTMLERRKEKPGCKKGCVYSTARRF